MGFGLYGGLTVDGMSPAEIQSVAVALIVLGVLLMLPLVVTLVRKALAGNRSG